MKISCHKESLIEGLQAVQAALSPRTTLPILMSFLMETEESRLKLVSTDLEVGVKHYAEAQVESGGSVAVPAKKFFEMLHSLPDGQDVHLNLDSNHKLSIHCGRSHFMIAGNSKAEYPLLPALNGEQSFKISARHLIQMTSQTLFSAALNETQHVLGGVLWSAKDGRLEMTAVDGRRLASSWRDIIPREQSFQAIVPHKVLSELLRLSSLYHLESRASQDIQVIVADNKIVFNLGKTTILSRLLSGNFPNYKHVIPSHCDFSVSVPVQDLLTTTQRAALCAGDHGGVVQYLFSSGSLKISASSPYSEYNDEIPIPYSRGPFQIVFNPVLISEALKHIDSEKATLGFTTPTSAVRIEPDGGGEYLFVVVPVHKGGS